MREYQHPAASIKRDPDDPEPMPYYVEWRKTGHLNGDTGPVNDITEWLEINQRSIANKGDVLDAINALFPDTLERLHGRWK